MVECAAAADRHEGQRAGTRRAQMPARSRDRCLQRLPRGRVLAGSRFNCWRRFRSAGSPHLAVVAVAAAARAMQHRPKDGDGAVDVWAPPEENATGGRDMKNLDWLRTSLRLRTRHYRPPQSSLDAPARSDAVEALLYLRRARELLESGSTIDIRDRIDRSIDELRQLVVRAQQA